MPNIKEIALNIADKSGAVAYSPAPLRAVRGYSFTFEQLQNFAEALIAELAKENDPVYAFRRKGLDDFCTCDKQRFDELSQKPNLFEVRVLYTLPPTASQIEQETAEACADLLVSRFGHEVAGTLAIRSGAWKEFKHD